MNFISIVQSKLSNFRSIKTSPHTINQKQGLLKDLKLCTLQFQTIPPSTLAPNVSEFELLRDVLEEEMTFYCETQDEKSFELAYQQAKCVYFDYAKIFKKRSDKFLYFVGLYLLYLLSNNKTTEFSTEIELLDISDRDDKYIKISLEIERIIMEGNYSKIESFRNVGDPFYNFYLSKFDNAIRYQIARAMEKSYDSLKLTDAMQLLLIKNIQDLQEFIKIQNGESNSLIDSGIGILENNNNENREIYWKINGDRIEFIQINQSKETIPAMRIMRDALFLGVETEKII